jgi:uncharacterized protein YifN (PemK superfamily)
MIMILFTALSGCKYIKYSFKEGNIPPEVRSISIAYIDNKAGIVVPQLGQQLTDKLRQKYMSETRLDIIPTEGDYDIKGSITGYAAEPVALQAGQTASQNQLKVTVQIQFRNKINPKADFNETFTQFAEYGSDKSLTSVELALIPIVTEKLAVAIFNKTLSDW